MFSVKYHNDIEKIVSNLMINIQWVRIFARTVNEFASVFGGIISILFSLVYGFSVTISLAILLSLHLLHVVYLF